MIENFFETIDTEAKAYFLGLMFADGCVCFDKRKRCRVLLASSDLHIIETLKNELQSLNKIHVIQPRPHTFKDGKTYWSKIHYNFEVCNKSLFKDLVSHGCTPRKSHTLKFPTTVPDNLMHHFIRGLWDGDGCIYKNNTRSIKHFRSAQFTWSVCGTRDICTGTNKIFTKFLNFPESIINKTKDREVHYYHVGGNDRCKNIFNYIYNDCSPHLCLERKRIKFEQIWHLIPLKCNGEPWIRQTFVSKISSTSASLPFSISKD